MGAGLGDGRHPNVDRLHVLRHDRTRILDFLEWLDSGDADPEGLGRPVELCTRFGPTSDYFVPLHEKHLDLVLRHLGVDKEKLEEERRNILDEQRGAAERQEEDSGGEQLRAGGVGTPANGPGTGHQVAAE